MRDDDEEEAKAWARTIGQVRSNRLQSIVRWRESQGEFETREAFHRAMLEARNFSGDALEVELRREMERERSI